ncbi:MAG: phosphatidylserine decarboxylase [Burkholderiales bacterium]|nr:phosphatidylserine decarboxylase [Burkholderiales bacterium]
MTALAHSGAHQYIERATGAVRTEQLIADRAVGWLYSTAREHAPTLFKALTSRVATDLIAALNYSVSLRTPWIGVAHKLRKLGVNIEEMVAAPHASTSLREIFERQIRYWECRPLPEHSARVVSPCDARVLVGNSAGRQALLIKQKFFELAELFGAERKAQPFAGGDWAIFRLTPEKYHYNHVPVSGRVVDFYEVDGAFHSCNPSALISVASPYARNRRAVTIIDSDVVDGTGVGRVAMIEVVALMIGQVVQRYSEIGYSGARPLGRGMFIGRGAVKSLFRPGSSTVLLLFEKGRIKFDDDLLGNSRRTDVCSRFSVGFGAPLVETDVRVRSSIGVAIQPDGNADWGATEGTENEEIQRSTGECLGGGTEARFPRTGGFAANVSARRDGGDGGGLRAAIVTPTLALPRRGGWNSSLFT